MHKNDARQPDLQNPLMNPTGSLYGSAGDRPPRITFKSLQRSSLGWVILIFFLCAWLGLGTIITLPLLSSPDPGLMTITKSGFRATGALIEFGNYDNPGTVSRSIGDSISFKNTTTHSVTLCAGQNGDCDTQQPWHVTLDPGESTDIPFQDVGGYSFTINATDGPPFIYNNLTISVSDNSDNSN